MASGVYLVLKRYQVNIKAVPTIRVTAWRLYRTDYLISNTSVLVVRSAANSNLAKS